MKTMLSLPARFIATVFAAEFASGFVPWLEDAYVRDHTPLVGRLVGRPHTIHHHYPRHMTRHEAINHAECYVRGNVHTNGLENFGAC